MCRTGFELEHWPRTSSLPGGLAAGSVLWGLAVRLAGTESALFIAAALLVLPPLAGLRWRLAGLSRLDLRE